MCCKRFCYSACVFGRRNYLSGGRITSKPRQHVFLQPYKQGSKVVKSGEKLFRLGAANACIIPLAFSVGVITIMAAK
jgi:hypothetical protein